MRIVFIICCIFFSVFLQAQTFTINDTTEFVSLDEKTYFFTTKLDSLKIEELINKKWTKNDNGGNFGLVKDIYWLKFEFDNISNSEKELFLFFPYNYVNFLDIYHVFDGEINLLSELGTVRNKLNNERLSRGWVTKINFPVNSSTIIIKAKNIYAPLRVNSFLLDEKILDSTIIDSYNLLWFWKGLFIFALSISLVSFYFLRFNLFFYYFLFNLGLFVYLGVDFGDLNSLFIDNPNNRAVDIQRVAIMIVLIFFPKFLNEITPIKKYNPIIWKFIKIGLVCFIILWFVNLFPVIKNSIIYYYSSFYFIYYTITIVLLQLYFLFRAFLDKENNSRILLLLYFIFIVSLVTNAFSQALGFSADGLYVYNTVLYSSVFQVVTFLFLAGYSLVIIIKERNELIKLQSIHNIELIKAVVDSQESERNIVGRELHDMIGANLAVIKQKTDKANILLVKLIDDTIDAIRALSHGLITPQIKHSNFEDEIHDLLSMFKTDTMKVKYYFHKWPNLKNDNNANNLYRIIQELLQNALKHSEATEVYLQFLNHDSNLSVMYEDNGKGFDVENKSNFGRGLFNIENRVSIMNGTINIDSNNMGTTISIEFENL